MTAKFYTEYLRKDAMVQRLLYAMNPAKFRACEYLMRFHEARGDKVIVFSDNVFALKKCASRPLAHVPTCPRAHVPTCLRAHSPACSLAHVPTSPLPHLLTCSLACVYLPAYPCPSHLFPGVASGPAHHYLLPYYLATCHSRYCLSPSLGTRSS